QVSARDRLPARAAAHRDGQAAALSAARFVAAIGLAAGGAMKALQPPGWVRPAGYANGVAARGTLVVVAGQVGWDAQQRFESVDFVAQAAQALDNVVAVLREVGATPAHVVRMTWYVVDKQEYVRSLPALGER